jgi:hypothetical protein
VGFSISFKEKSHEPNNANALNRLQAKNVDDKSVLRTFSPRLLPVSPYLMRFNQLSLAQDAILDLMSQKKDSDLITKLKIITRIIVKERIKKQPHY